MTDKNAYVVYQCRACRYIHFVPDDGSIRSTLCGFCGSPLDDPLHMETVQGVLSAKQAVQRLALELRSSRPRVQRSLGVKRRVLGIVQSQIENNRGQPTSLAAVLEECLEVGISEERASHFMDLLEEEGVIRVDSEQVELGGGQH
ncbi:MAG: hypothetical protein HXY34_00495 [Candidatus Thorarchaeota archaeon]|nr:hypothetical protein [Candidatus Thorarchaeota archaeon]